MKIEYVWEGENNMFQIDTVMMDVKEMIVDGELRHLEYVFPNKHKLEIQKRHNELEFYYVTTEEKKDKVTTARFITVSKVNTETLIAILNDFARIIEEAEKRAELKFPEISVDEIKKQYMCA